MDVASGVVYAAVEEAVELIPRSPPALESSPLGSFDAVSTVARSWQVSFAAVEAARSNYAGGMGHVNRRPAVEVWKPDA